MPYDPALAAWVAAVRPLAEATLEDPDLRAQWLRCGGTWFAGVNALPNDEAGAVPAADVPPLNGLAVQFVRDELGFRGAYDQAQVSICFPGYPRPWEGESEAAFRFRRDRDAAHVDGLRRHEPGRRRRLGETHAFILGVPISDVAPEAAPFTIYEGSHEIMRAAFQERFAGIAPQDWGRGGRHRGLSGGPAPRFSVLLTRCHPWAPGRGVSGPSALAARGRALGRRGGRRAAHDPLFQARD